jgi:hypothetical protein
MTGATSDFSPCLRNLTAVRFRVVPAPASPCRPAGRRAPSAGADLGAAAAAGASLQDPTIPTWQSRLPSPPHPNQNDRLVLKCIYFVLGACAHSHDWACNPLQHMRPLSTSRARALERRLRDENLRAQACAHPNLCMRSSVVRVKGKRKTTVYSRPQAVASMRFGALRTDC